MPFEQLQRELDQRAASGLLRQRRTLDSPQAPHISIDGKSYLSFCSNDYLGLANHPEIVKAAHEGLNQYGVGMASVRFICGIFFLKPEQTQLRFVDSHTAIQR